MSAEGELAGRLADAAASQCSRTPSPPSAAACAGLSLSIAPNYEGVARAIDRASLDLSPAEFYEQYASRGLPVVLSLNSSTTLWHEHVQTLQEMRRNMTCRDRRCSMGVHKLADWPLVRMGADLLPRVFLPGSTPIEWALGAFVGETAFTAFEGEDFGVPTHFDTECTASLSLQYQGRKRWMLWAPWPLNTSGGAPIEAHTRFETELEPSEALFFAPAWFHATVVLEGESLAVVHAWDGPVYAALDTAPRGASPFGFELCDWKTRSTRGLPAYLAHEYRVARPYDPLTARHLSPNAPSAKAQAWRGGTLDPSNVM